MITLLGFIGFVITILVALPATLIAFIRILSHPIREVVNLWLELIDTILDIIQSVKNDFLSRK